MSDVCLMLEGTYPYVSGGVSSCVHQLITKLPNIHFSLVYIGTRSDEFLTPKYAIPSNVQAIHEVFLFDRFDDRLQKRPLSKSEYQALQDVHQALHQGNMEQTRLRQSIQILFSNRSERSPVFNALASEKIWNLLVEEYKQNGGHLPFIDFFYTWRSAHLPLYRILDQRYPKAGIYHALCTGYAGLAAVAASVQNNAPMFLTEHGIYAHEREMEISEADWIYSGDPDEVSAFESSDSLKQWWIDLFRNMSKVAYHFSSEIITLYEANRQRQISDGADPHRTRIIPNGIGKKFYGLRSKQPDWKGSASGETFHIGFLGRVVPIKDIKMLIKAIRAVLDEYPSVQVDLIGPTEEDPDYVKECQELIRVLGLHEIIKFTGPRNAVDVFSGIDCLVLSSISEAQPLVILEANSAGVPVVATEVGSCAELLLGKDDTDRLLGASGIISPIGDSETFAKNILQLIHQPEKWKQFSEAGMERVRTCYDEDILTSTYEILYRDAMSKNSHFNLVEELPSSRRSLR